MKDHFMVNMDGHLYDTRKPDWSRKLPLRAFYRFQWNRIKNTDQLKATIRQRCVWPGGYEIVFLTHDGEVICHDCVKAELRNVLDSINTETDDGWWVTGSTIIEEPGNLCCAHCSTVFYPDEEEEDANQGGEDDIPAGAYNDYMKGF